MKALRSIPGRIGAAALPRILLSAAAAAWLGACILEKDNGTGEGPSTETGNPNLSGKLVDGGLPVSGTVKLFRLPPHPAVGTEDTTAILKPTLVRSLAVSADGRYRFDSLPNALYALEAQDASGRKFALVPDLAIAAPKDTLRRDLALNPPARLRGRVTRGPNALPAGIIANENILVRVGGADRSALTDTSGAYVIENVPVGVYRMAFAAADGHYQTAYLDKVTAVAGADTELPPVDLLWSRFVAPPAVSGIAFTRDSAGNSVALHWHPVRLSGGAIALYRIARRAEGDVARDWQTADTLLIDSLGLLPKGTALKYTVQAVNPLGQGGPIDTLPPLTAPGPKLIGPAAGSLAGIVLSGGTALKSARIRLYSIAAAPGSRDSLPLAAKPYDSAITDIQGGYRFDSLPAGRYTLTAEKPGATDIAIRMGLSPRGPGTAPDTLVPAPPGTISGAATRDSSWVTNPGKGDENIWAVLSGAPFATVTSYGAPPAGGPFTLTGIPAGSYRLVVYAIPEGYYLPDTLDVTVTSGLTTKLPAVVKAKYNPAAPPPKITGLQSAGLTRTHAQLTWTPPKFYPLLKGYRVLRLGADLAVLDSSAVIPVAAYADDIAMVPVGTVLNYVVRVVAQDGREGENGGDFGGRPVQVTVPGP